VKALRQLILGVVVGLLLGLWFGVNIGKDKPVLSNPFAERTVQDRVKRTGGEILQKSAEALEKGGKALQGKFDK
jgi:hypothetical protein